MFHGKINYKWAISHIAMLVYRKVKFMIVSPSFCHSIRANCPESPWTAPMFSHASGKLVVYPGIGLFSENWEEQHGHFCFAKRICEVFCWENIWENMWRQFLVGCKASDQLTHSQARGELNYDHRGPAWNWVMGVVPTKVDLPPEN